MLVWWLLTFFSEVWVDRLRVETCNLRDCCRGHSELSEAAFSINEDELYSSISSYSMREKAVRELLTRHCQLLETPESWAKETFLTQKLCVPAEWIHEAKAVRAHMESDKHLEALYLFKAGHWNRCHKLVIRHLASGECFTRGLCLLESDHILPTSEHHDESGPSWCSVWDMADVRVNQIPLWKLSVQKSLGQDEGLAEPG